ncbi:MAG: RpiB/LacA/LacB family sugar-phosphate isomerase [Patescibacteria group bacterium]
MKIFLGTDHAGFELKEKIKNYLQDKGYEVEDCGAYEFNKDDDYPDFIGKAAEGVSTDPQARGIVLGGSGQAEAMVANKFSNVRCALFYSPAVPVFPADVTGRTSADPLEIARLTREHNDANMLSLGARFLKEEDVMKVVEMWLETPFSNDERHIRRLSKLKQIENGK